MSNGRTVALDTLGCKLNYSETSAVERLLQNDGFTTKDFTDKADVYVINTCSVTENADKECRQLVRWVGEMIITGFRRECNLFMCCIDDIINAISTIFLPQIVQIGVEAIHGPGHAAGQLQQQCIRLFLSQLMLKSLAVPADNNSRVALARGNEVHGMPGHFFVGPDNVIER